MVQELLFTTSGVSFFLYLFFCVMVDKNSFRGDIASIPMRFHKYKWVKVLACILLAVIASSLLLLAELSKEEGLKINIAIRGR